VLLNRPAIIAGGRLLPLLLCLLTPAAVDAADIKNGGQVYRQNCASCHDSGINEAPKVSDAENWGRRLRWPRFVTNSRAINGYGTMPAKGGNPVLSNDDVKDAVAYIVYRVENPNAVDETKHAQGAPASRAAAKPRTRYHEPPADSDIPNDKYGEEVRFGKLVFTQTWKYARRYSGNDMSCSNCHRDAGRMPNSAPLWAAYGMYPAYSAKNDRNNTLQERIQQCFRFSMNGIAPPLDAPELRALMSYMHFLSNGVPIGDNMPGRGYPEIHDTGYDPSPSRGADVFNSRCVACHGADGAGRPNPEGGYQFPPLWGLDSYNKGAGMASVKLLSGFVKANMPPDQNPPLTPQEALDVAAYINQQLRPPDPRKGFFTGWFE